MKTGLGKDIFLWNVPRVSGGIPSAIAEKLVEGGFESVILKVADAGNKHVTNMGSIIRPRWVECVLPETVRIIKATAQQLGKPLKVYGYGFLYGALPTAEAHRAVSQTISLGLDGYVFDGESRFEEKPNAVGNARLIGSIFRQGCPTTPAIFCGFAMFRSWTGGTWHPEALHRAFMEWCDAGMPMSYWTGETPSRALAILNESVRQWRLITDKPILPAGRAYNGDLGIARAEAMIAFDERAHELGLQGESWWSLEHAIKLDPSIWAALRSMPNFLTTPPISPETPPPALTLEEQVTDHEQRLDALEAQI